MERRDLLPYRFGNSAGLYRCQCSLQWVRASTCSFTSSSTHAFHASSSSYASTSSHFTYASTRPGCTYTTTPAHAPTNALVALSVTSKEHCYWSRCDRGPGAPRSRVPKEESESA
jgi:hypothetical protein